MPNKFSVSMAVAVVLLAVGSGCDGNKKKADPPAPLPPVVKVPPEVVGTVAEWASLVTAGPQQVEGYGIVINLGANGSSECPPQIYKYLVDYLRKQKLGSAIYNTADLTPERIIRSPDTAVVEVRGAIPPGAPKDTQFDLLVTALPGTQTRSLDGGILMTTEIHRAAGGMSAVNAGLPQLAEGSGQVLLNPFIDQAKEQVKCRSGRVVGGGKVLKSQEIHLQLYQDDWARLNLLQKRINERFPGPTKTANARGGYVEITIPSPWRADYEHFLELVMHVPLTRDAAQMEVQAMNVARMMELPTSRHEDLALTWEAMGRQAVPLMQRLYTSPNPPTAFFAARSGLRLGDESAAEVILRFARSAGSPMQLKAIEELGRHRMLLQAGPVLRELVDQDNDMVRVEAYRALLRRGDTSAVTTYDITGMFKVDVVACSHQYALSVSQSGEQRIVLFGQNIPVSHDIFFEAPDDLVSISGRSEDDRMSVDRKLLRSARRSDAFQVDFKVLPLIIALGSRVDEKGPDGKIPGLGLTYSQVVSTLYHLCKDGHIRAKFVLQPLPAVQKINQGVAAAGRPDMAAAP